MEKKEVVDKGGACARTAEEGGEGAGGGGGEEDRRDDKDDMGITQADAADFFSDAFPLSPHPLSPATQRLVQSHKPSSSSSASSSSFSSFSLSSAIHPGYHHFMYLNIYCVRHYPFFSYLFLTQFIETSTNSYPTIIYLS